MIVKRKEALEQAINIVCADRDQMYGTPEDNFSTIAGYWTHYLGTNIGPEDVAVMMILMKIARISASEYKSVDSWVDIAGYAACGCEIVTDRDEEVQSEGA